MKGKNFDQMMSDYLDKFDEVFPARIISDPEEAMGIMKECLKTGKPYNPYADKDFDPKADY